MEKDKKVKKDNRGEAERRRELEARERRGSDRIEGINQPLLVYTCLDVSKYPRAPLSKR